MDDRNDDVADNECPLHNVGSTGELDAAPPRDSASEPMDDRFDPATQLLLFTAVNNGNDSVTNNKCLLPTKQQRSTSSCGNPILDYDSPDE